MISGDYVGRNEKKRSVEEQHNRHKFLFFYFWNFEKFEEGAKTERGKKIHV